MERYSHFVTHRPLAVLGVGLGLTLVFAAQIVDLGALELRLRIETEIEKILPQEGPDRDFYAHFRETFGNFEMVFVGVVDADVFTADGLRRIRDLTLRLEGLDGVRRVLSLSNAPGIRSEGGDVRVAAPFDEVPEDPAELSRIRARVLGDPLYLGNLVSRNARATALLIYPDEMSEAEFRKRGIDREIERVAREVVGRTARVLVAGNPPLKATTGRLLLRDLMLLVPSSFVFMGAIAFFSHRSFLGVLVPLSTIALSQIWTMGTMVMP